MGVYLESGEDLTNYHARNENPKQWPGRRWGGKALGVLVLLQSWEFAHSVLQKAAQWAAVVLSLSRNPVSQHDSLAPDLLKAYSFPPAPFFLCFQC